MRPCRDCEERLDGVLCPATAASRECCGRVLYSNISSKAAANIITMNVSGGNSKDSPSH